MQTIESRVSVPWLGARLGSPGLVVVDVALGGVGRIRIPGSEVLDLDGPFSDPATDLPHMMPSAEEFARQVRALGVDATSRIVLVDPRGVYAAPRAWWMFRSMGHAAVGVLDGGLPAWVESGLPVSVGLGRTRLEGDFAAQPEPGWFCDADAVEAALRDPDCVVVDVRSRGRFEGAEPEPRPGLRGGHMPGSRNLPFHTLLESGRYRPEAEIRAILAPVVGDARRIVFSCGSGVTACVGALAARMAGHRDVRVYDGSWSEWGRPASGRPVESGPTRV